MFPTKLYLDLNLYCRAFNDQTQPRLYREARAVDVIFRRAQRQLYEIYWSYVLHTENLANQNEIERRIVLWQANNCRQSMLPHLDIDMLANQIRTLSSISGYDAEHIACAEVGGCDYLLTGDDRLLTRFNRLKVSGALALNVVLQNPVDFLMSLPEEENGDER